MNLVNFHCHTFSDNHHIEVLSTEEVTESFVKELKDNQFFTIGLHPWKLQNFKELFPTFKELINKYKDHPQFLGAGEFGIDKVRCDVSLEQQISFLKKILTFLKIEEIEVLVFHNVRAHQEIFEVLSDTFENMKEIKTIFHDFNGNKETIKFLSDKLDCYFSVGPTYYRKNSKISQALNEISLNRLFLETDDSSISIEDHYNEVEKKLAQQGKLAKQCLTNFQSLKEVK